MNAGTNNEYQKVHPNQNEDRLNSIIENLIWLKEYKKNKFASPIISLSNVISNINFSSCVKMMDIGIKVGAQTVSFRPVTTFQEIEKFALSKNDLKVMAHSLENVNAIARKYGISTNINEFNQLILLRSAKYIPAPCFVGAWLSTMIMANGDVIYCCNSRKVIGNVGESSFESIWFSIDRYGLNDKALQIHKTQTSLPNSRCIDCEQSLLNNQIYSKCKQLWGKAVPYKSITFN